MFAITPIILLVLVIAGGGAAAIDEANDEAGRATEPRGRAEQIVLNMDIDPKDAPEQQPELVIQPGKQPVPEFERVK